MISEAAFFQFRCFERAHFAFSPGLNWIFGPNAQGKSSLLEGLFFLILGRSFRHSSLHESCEAALRHGQKTFQVAIGFESNGLAQELRLSSDGKNRQATLSCVPLASFHNILGQVPGVLLSAFDRDLLHGGPFFRRRALDLQLCQQNPIYIHHLRRYTRALLQKNALLKQKASCGLEAFEEIMVTSGTIVTQCRKKACEDLTPQLQHFFHKLGCFESTLEVRYKPSFNDDAKSTLEKIRARELRAGHCLVGPQRDELVFTLDKKPLIDVGSEGQKQIALIAFRLSQKALLPPHAIFAVDDFGSFLDEKRRALLLEEFFSMNQVIITSTAAPPQRKDMNCLNIYTDKNGHLPEQASVL